jgi:ABC-2 type transport system ATP-binding protein
MSSTVSVSHLMKKFGNFTAVDDVSFEVARGEIFGFLGPNGAGKSTTIRMLCGILKPTSGEGHILDHRIGIDQESIKSNIGYMSQKFSLYDDLSIAENLEFFGAVYGLTGSGLTKRINHLLREEGLLKMKQSTVRDLPAGVKQRLALSASTIHDPEILFLDEPTSGVDPDARRTFWELIYGYASRGKTIFVTTHYMDEAEHCGRIALIIAGRLIALDTPDRLKESLNVKIYRIVCMDFLKAYTLLSKMKHVEEAALFGTDIHVMTSHEHDMKKYIVPQLEKSIGRFTVKRVSPTLEDVFVVNARN